MRFSGAIFSFLTLTPLLGAFASSDNERRQENSSMASIFSSIQSKMDELIPAGTQPINDPGLALTTVSSVFDFSNIVNAAMDTFDAGDESLFVYDGKKLDEVQIAEKVVQLWQSFGNAASLVKGSGSGTVAEVVHMIAFNLELCSENISRVAQGVAKLPNVVEAAKANKDLMAGIVDSMLGSALVDSLTLTE